MEKSADIKKRAPIWIALSQFYLDTELTNGDFDNISSIFQNSGFSIQELKQIDLMEVFPLLQSNLLSPAGVWFAFEEEWLVVECEKRYWRRNNIFHQLICKFWNFFFYGMRREYWNEIEKRITQTNFN